MHLETIVLADDQSDILQVASELLSPEYYVIAKFSSGPELLRKIDQISASVIVLDISMGEMSGFEVASALMERESAAKIVFLSVHEDPCFIRAAMDGGAVGYVFKSRMDTDLKDAIAAVLKGNTYISGGNII